MKKPTTLFYIFLLATLFAGIGAFAGNYFLERTVEKDYTDFSNSLAFKDSFFDYTSTPVAGVCLGKQFDITSGGFSITEYKNNASGFELSNYVLKGIEFEKYGCLPPEDIITVCNYGLGDLLTKEIPTHYYTGTVMEKLVNSEHMQGFYTKLKELPELKSEYHLVANDDNMLPTGFPHTVTSQSRFNGIVCKLLITGNSGIRYRIAENRDAIKKAELIYQLSGTFIGFIVACLISFVFFFNRK
ncbi:hypothetical protein GCM10028824_20140 [Hymenobacter segetis]